MKAKKNIPQSSTAIYNKEKTKSKLIKAVGEILVKEGFQNIRVNKVESVAGVSKKAIYDYFGGIDGLIKSYLDQVDFWKTQGKNLSSKNINDSIDIDDKFMFQLLKNDFEFFYKSKEMQKIILWGISEKNKSIRLITEEREKIGEQIFQQIDQKYSAEYNDIRAVSAILVAAIYYMGLHSRNNGSTMCGIDISKIEGKNRVLNAMQEIIKTAFSDKKL